MSELHGTKELTKKSSKQRFTSRNKARWRTKKLTSRLIKAVISIVELPYSLSASMVALYTPPSLVDNQGLNAGTSRKPNLVITNVRLPHSDPVKAKRLWKVECRGGRVSKVSDMQDGFKVTSERYYCFDCKGAFMLPALCHPHIHLDKCFIMSKCGHLDKGDFEEAMTLTDQAKASFDKKDLYSRGARLIVESVEAGVTSMRAHVEVDTTVGLTCVDVGLQLRRNFRPICDVQIAAFAQNPLFSDASGDTPGANYDRLKEAAILDGVTVVGSAPYVEKTLTQMKRNIQLVLSLAVEHGLNVDFHLDYNINPDSEPLIYEVIDQARCNRYWTQTYKGVPRPRITIGHASRLQLFPANQWRDLKAEIGDLPISIVGLPQSDMYMLGRLDQHKPLGAPRSTLRVPQIEREYGIRVAMGVNNVDNPFTPQGSLDPLSLCTFGVAVFQTATTEDISILARSVTTTSRLAIASEENHKTLFPSRLDPADFVILHDNFDLQSAILCPSYDRTTIRAGQIVARRKTNRWNIGVGEAKWYRRKWTERIRWKTLLCPPYAAFLWVQGRLFKPMVIVLPREYEQNFSDTDSVALVKADDDVTEDEKVLRNSGIDLKEMKKYPEWVVLRQGTSLVSSLT
ncbi:hypothetical protein ONZ45_g16603 [Pleurotus djamor]|nr:hypothetical protein ONZ45_g16603 [Pleurotus djamor]